MVFVQELNRLDSSFYDVMGPYFGSREIAKEVGIHLYDDSDKRWFVAVEVAEIVGFASFRKGLISDCYVAKVSRNQGVFTCVLRSLILLTTGPLRANCTELSKKAFESHGFVAKRKTKNFTYMELSRA